VVLRGYDRREVDRFLLGEDDGPFGRARFSVARRGYDRDEVDAFLDQLRNAHESWARSAGDGTT
jgi:DivIVA domain-containing protein